MSIFGFLNLKPRKQEEPIETQEATQEKEEVQPMNHPDPYTVKFERLCNKILEFEVCMNSPLDSSPIGVVRTEDVVNTIAEFYSVDISKTSLSQFKK